MYTNPYEHAASGHDVERYLTPKEICIRLQIPEQTFYQWRVKHEGPRAYRVGRHLRISVADFEQWLAQRADS